MIRGARWVASKEVAAAGACSLHATIVLWQRDAALDTISLPAVVSAQVASGERKPLGLGARWRLRRR
jgi:hypothetical protein